MTSNLLLHLVIQTDNINPKEISPNSSEKQTCQKHEDIGSEEKWSCKINAMFRIKNQFQLLP